MTVLSDMDTPVFAAEGLPDKADPDSWRVKIDGFTSKKAELALKDFKAMPNTTVNARLTSVSGWSVRADWDGVLWRDFIKAYPPDPSATHVIFESVGGYTTNVPLSAGQRVVRKGRPTRQAGTI